MWTGAVREDSLEGAEFWLVAKDTWIWPGGGKSESQSSFFLSICKYELDMKTSLKLTY